MSTTDYTNNPFTLPFRYDSDYQWIADTDGVPVLQMSGMVIFDNGKHLPEQEASRIQDDFGQLVTDLLNQHFGYTPNRELSHAAKQAVRWLFTTDKKVSEARAVIASRWGKDVADELLSRFGKEL